MQLEQLKMEQFVGILTSDEPISNPLRDRHQVYRDMVAHRFVETIENIYPILSKQLGEKLFSLIREFQRHGAQSPLIIEMAFEFGEFLKTDALYHEISYLDDLLWLEWGEMELLLGQFDDEEIAFDWDGHYCLSSSARLRRLHIPVYRGDFENCGEYPLLLFYDFVEKRVYFEEITALGYELLRMLPTNTPRCITEEFARRYHLCSDDFKEPLGQLLKTWCNKKILTKRGVKCVI